MLQETHAISNQDLIFGPINKNGLPEFIELSERITKTRRGQKNDVRELDGRVYLDDDNPEICPVRNMLEFQRRKTQFQRSPDFPLLLTVKASAEKNPGKEVFWYTNGRMGVNTIAKLFKLACEKVGFDPLKEKVSSTSCRKGLVQSGVESNVPGPLISKMLGQKNIDSKLEYLKTKEKSHKAASIAINRAMAGVKDDNFTDLFSSMNNDGREIDSNCQESTLESNSITSTVQEPQPSSSFHQNSSSTSLAFNPMASIFRPHLLQHHAVPSFQNAYMSPQPFVHPTFTQPTMFGTFPPQPFMQPSQGWSVPSIQPYPNWFQPQQVGVAQSAFPQPILQPNYFAGNTLTHVSSYAAGVAHSSNINPTVRPVNEMVNEQSMKESKNGGKECKNAWNRDKK